jgi:hypothetical protein
MARKRKDLAKAGAALVATALVEKAIQKAAEDPRVRRKAKSVGRALKQRVKAAGKKITTAIKKRSPKQRRAAARKRRVRART